MMDHHAFVIVPHQTGWTAYCLNREQYLRGEVPRDRKWELYLTGLNAAYVFPDRAALLEMLIDRGELVLAGGHLLDVLSSKLTSQDVLPFQVRPGQRYALWVPLGSQVLPGHLDGAQGQVTLKATQPLYQDSEGGWYLVNDLVEYSWENRPVVEHGLGAADRGYNIPYVTVRVKGVIGKGSTSPFTSSVVGFEVQGQIRVVQLTPRTGSCYLAAQQADRFLDDLFVCEHPVWHQVLGKLLTQTLQP